MHRAVDRNSAYRMNVAFYKLFTQHKITDLHQTATILSEYMLYLHNNELVSLVETSLLYKPPGDDAHSVLAVEILNYIRHSGFKNAPSYEANFTTTLKLWSCQFPAVAALLDEPLHELPPDRDDKVRVCAYPGCNIDGKGLFNKMMKCGRCHHVYYCCDTHQKQHWPLHRQSCCKLTTTA